MLNVNIYPVPASEKLTIDIDLKSRQDFTFEIINNNNQVILKEEIRNQDKINKEIELGGFASGIYHVRIYNKDILHISKIIVE